MPYPIRLQWHTKPYTESLLSLLHACCPGDDWTRILMKEMLAAMSAKVLIDHGDDVRLPGKDKVCGAIMCAMKRTEGFVYRVVVAPEYRRKGWGSFMLNSVLRLNPTKSFKANVPERNLAAQQLLVACGFSFDPQAPRIKDWDGQDFYTFTRDRERKTDGT